jgi:monovalent cation/proton antiporter MnhG/PhaG subunit
VIAREIISDVLLGLAVVIVLSASLGVLLMRDAYQRLHFVTPATLVAPILVALAVLVQMGLSENTGETCLALVFLIIAGPYLSHATMRALRVREKGDWRPGKGRLAVETVPAAQTGRAAETGPATETGR